MLNTERIAKTIEEVHKELSLIEDTSEKFNLIVNSNLPVTIKVLLIHDLEKGDSDE